MPAFRYRAYGAGGDLAEGEIDAASQEVAESMLWAKGLAPLDLRQASGAAGPWWKREVFSFSGSGRTDLVALTRELSELIGSGIPFDDCLRILSDQSGSGKIQQISNDLLEKVVDGSTLADAMQQQSYVFPLDYLNVVRAGEMSGTLDQAFEELAELMERRAALDDRLKSALVYPVILIVLAIVSVGIVIGVLVPSITPIFMESGKPIPDTVRMMIWMHDNGLWLVLAIGAVLVLAVSGIMTIQRSPTRGPLFDRYKLGLPLIGIFITRGEAARFSRTLGTLIKAGVPLLQASIAAQSVVSNRWMSAKIDHAVALIRDGKSLSVALRGEEIFPTVALRFISVGEETAKLDKMLLRAAAMFEDRNRRGIDGFMALLTPALTLLIALLVGGLLFTVMSAILGINELAGA